MLDIPESYLVLRSTFVAGLCGSFYSSMHRLEAEPRGLDGFMHFVLMLFSISPVCPCLLFLFFPPNK